MITSGRHGPGSDDDALVRTVVAAADAGAHLIQVREHGVGGSQLARLVRACLAAVRGTPARVLVNDRLDVALATGAHGVHLRESSMPAAAARAIGPPGFLIGRSVHSAEDAARAGREHAADYLVFGPVFATPSKPGAIGAGLDELRRTVQGTSIPVLAVGGVDAANAGAIAATGAAGLAAIRWWSSPSQETLANATQRLAAAFAER